MLQSELVRDIFTQVAEGIGTTRAVVIQLLRVAAIWGGAWIAYQVVKRIAKRIIQAVDDGDDSTMTAAEKRGHTIAQLIKSVGRMLVIVVALLITINEFMSIAPLLAVGGILGLAVSFGSQSLVKDVIAGFFILIENQFAVGDVIEAAGKSGTVEKMTLRVAMLRDIRGILHVIPNGQITVVSNLTRSWSRAVVEVGVGYGTDIDRAIAVFRDELARMQADTPWNLRFAGDSEVQGVEQLGEHGVVIRTLLRTVPGAQWDVAREFRRRIKNRLDQEDIEIPFPQRTVHVRHHAGGITEVPADQV